MRYTFVLGLYALMSAASAQSQCDGAAIALPQCAQSCFIAAIPSVGCAVTDYKCQCAAAAQQALSSAVIPCVATACPASSFGAVAASASAVCACAATAPALASNPVATTTAAAATSAPATATSPSKTTKAAVSNMGSVAPSMITSFPASFVSSLPKTTSVCTPGVVSKDCGAVAAAIPSCAIGCFVGAIQSAGLGVADYAGQCNAAGQAAISAGVIPCVATACPAASYAAVAQSASAVCACAASPGTVTNSCPATRTGSGGSSFASGSFASSFPTGSFASTTKPVTTTTTVPTTSKPAVATGGASTSSSSLLALFACVGLSVLGSAVLL